MRIKRLRQIITLGSLGLAIVHIAWPRLSIDAITLALLTIGVVPWLAPIIKSLELPGGWKIELQDLQKVATQADNAGLLSSSPDTSLQTAYSFQTIADTDPNLALAGLRIELEKRLVLLADKHQIGTNMQGLGRLMHELTKKNVLNNDEEHALSNMIKLLNAAVHGADVDKRATEWAIKIGPRLIRSLEEKKNSYDLR